LRKNTGLFTETLITLHTTARERDRISHAKIFAPNAYSTVHKVTNDNHQGILQPKTRKISQPKTRKIQMISNMHSRGIKDAAVRRIHARDE